MVQRIIFFITATVLISVLAKAQAPYAFKVDSVYQDSLYLPAFTAPAQTLEAYETKLNATGTLLLRSKNPILRQEAADSLLVVIQRALLLPGAYSYPWKLLTTVKSISPPTKEWRIFSWQHFVNDSTYQYHGILQQKEHAQTIHVLKDSAQHLGLELEYELHPDQWYGCLYYGVEPFKTKKGKDAWVLFGYDADGYTHRRKVADILTFSRSKTPLFGKEVFVGTEQDSSYRFARLILEYRVDSRVGLRFNPDLGGIAFDHLITGPPVLKGGPPSNIPDGSYDGYVYNKKLGEWHWRMEWFDRVTSKEAPRPQPILDSEKRVRKDVFGRPAKTRG